MSERDGGPAFPVAGTYWNDSEHKWELGGVEAGMTVRDYFAAKAMQGMQGMLMCGDVGGDYVGYVETGDWRGIAKQAYAMADAMLKERAA